MWTKVQYDSGRQDQVTTTATQDDQGNISSVTQQVIRTWLVVDDGASGQPSLLSAQTASANGNTVPQAGENGVVIDGQGGFFCSQTIPKRTTQSPFVFEVQVQFTRKYQPSQQGKYNITISISGQEFTQTAYQAKASPAADGTTFSGSVGALVDIVNSAKQSFDPSLTKTYFDEVISISYNTTDADSGQFASLRGCVNSDSVSFDIKGQSRDFQPKQLLVKEISQSTTITTGDDNSTPVWKVSIQLVARQDKYTRSVLDAGYYEKDPNDSTKIIGIMDKYHQPISAPGRLDGHGHSAGPTANPVYLGFDVEDQADISGIFEGLS